jgi:mannose-6-phosphate isomerase
VSDDPVHAMLGAVLATPADEVADLAREVVAACVRLEASGDELGDAAAAVVGVAEEHPDDIGLVVLLLMHHRVLQPGEYIDVAAGVLHSYVRGLGIEVLANSDNVVRAGLTSKPVNVPELLRIVDPLADGVAGRGRVVEPGLEAFDSASDRFRLYRVTPGRALPGEHRPRIAFCLRGRVTLSSAARTLELGDVDSAFLPAGEGAVDLEGLGEVFVVTVPEA